MAFSIDRRELILGAGAAALVAAVGGLALPDAAAQVVPGQSPRRMRHDYRRRGRACFDYRIEAAKLARRRNRPMLFPENNGEEDQFPDRRWNYSKGLRHDALGHVDPAAYDALLHAVTTGAPADFDAIPIAGTRKLVSPQAGLAFDLEGPDSFGVGIRPAPRADAPEGSAEMAEVYWMALLRDVPFADWETDALVADGCADLSKLSDYRAPKVGGSVTPATLFRGNTAGDLAGPWVSQFLWRDVPFGVLTVNQRVRSALPGVDFVTTFDEWLAVQNGAPRPKEGLAATTTYIRSLRDLCYYVHYDALYEAYLNACLILLGLGAPFDPGIPSVHWTNQDGFAEFGGPHILSMLTEVATRALKAVWAQKWFVHRRARPEEFAARIDNQLAGRFTYQFDAEILNSAALPLVHQQHGTYLLPLAFPEGCPLHPSYASGHATVAGACVTMLKAFFDESWELPAPVQASADGTSLDPWDGPALTVGGELNKVASNIASARNAAGVHWRTDFVEGVQLGETVALGILEEQKASFNEQFSWTVTRFDGTTITI